MLAACGSLAVTTLVLAQWSCPCWLGWEATVGVMRAVAQHVVVVVVVGVAVGVVVCGALGRAAVRVGRGASSSESFALAALWWLPRPHDHLALCQLWMDWTFSLGQAWAPLRCCCFLSLAAQRRQQGQPVSLYPTDLEATAACLTCLMQVAVVVMQVSPSG